VLVLAVIIGIGSTLFSEFTAGFGGATPSIDDAMAIVLAALRCSASASSAPASPTASSRAARSSARRRDRHRPCRRRHGRGRRSAAGAVVSGGAALAGGAPPPPVAGRTRRRRDHRLQPGAAGQSGASAVASGLGNVASTGAKAAVSPLKRAAGRAADSLKQSYRPAARRRRRSPLAHPASGGEAAGAAAPASSATDGPPAWAKRMKRSQQMTHGVQAAAHAVRSGDSHGGGSSVNLSGSD
jgi:type IV secretion system protein TrbL